MSLLLIEIVLITEKTKCLVSNLPSISGLFVGCGSEIHFQVGQNLNGMVNEHL